jgi:hypothetical protein
MKLADHSVVSAGWVVCGLVLLVLAMNAGSLRGTEQLTVHSDNLLGAHPLRVEVARQWSAGRVPLWNPYKRAGSPLLADILAGALYPGNLPFLFASDEPRYRALEQVAVLHFVLAALLMYAFLRAIEVEPLAAMLGGLVFSANGTTLWLASNWIYFQSTTVWLPAILLGIHRATERRFWRWTGVGGFAVALQLLSGFPDYVFYSGIVAVAYAAFAVRGSRWRAIAAVLVVYAIGAGLAAGQILPTAELTLISRRGAHVALREFLDLSASPAIALGWVVPGISVPVVTKLSSTGGCYLGAIAIALAVEGIRQMDRRSLFFASVLVLAFLVAIGPASPVAATAYRIPGFSTFRYPFKHCFEIMFAVSVLAALGANALLRGRHRSIVTIAAATVIFVALGIWVRLGPSRDPAAASTATVAIGGCFVFLTALATRRRTAIVIVGIVALALGYYANRTDLLRTPIGDGGPPAGADAAALAKSLHEEVPWRYVLMTSSEPRAIQKAYRQQFLSADYPTEFGVPAIHGCCPLLWAPLGDALGMSDEGTFNAPQRLLGAGGRALDVLACRWVGLAQSASLGWTLLRVVRSSDNFTLAERPTALPPVRFVDEARCADPGAIAQFLRSGSEDLRTLAMLDCRNRTSPPGANRAAKAATLAVNQPGHLVVDTEVDGTDPAVLVASQSDLPGWEARVDGTAADVYRAYGLVQAVVVPAGRHEVVLDYRPASFRYGMIIALATFVCVAFAVWGEARGARSNLPPTAPGPATRR